MRLQVPGASGPLLAAGRHAAVRWRRAGRGRARGRGGRTARRRAVDLHRAGLHGVTDRDRRIHVAREHAALRAAALASWSLQGKAERRTDDPWPKRTAYAAGRHAAGAGAGRPPAAQGCLRCSGRQPPRRSSRGPAAAWRTKGCRMRLHARLGMQGSQQDRSSHAERHCATTIARSARAGTRTTGTIGPNGSSHASRMSCAAAARSGARRPQGGPPAANAPLRALGAYIAK